MQMRHGRLLFALMGLVLLLKCTSVPITDHMWCGSLGALGASCAHTLTDETQAMTLAQFAAWWDATDDPKVATTLSSLTELKADLEKLCTYTGDCSVTVQSKVEAAYNKINAAHKAAKGVVK